MKQFAVFLAAMGIFAGLSAAPARASMPLPPDNSALIAQIKAQIAALTAKLQALEAQQNSTKWCHTFATDLKVGDSGSEVSALQHVLTHTVTDLDDSEISAQAFAESTAAAVVMFQQQYRIRATGYVGPLTRAQLNKFYACGNVPPTFTQQTLTAGGITVASPRGTDRWVFGTLQTIRWVAPQGVAKVSITLEAPSTSNCETMTCAQRNGSAIYLITSQGSPAPNNGAFAWTVGQGTDLRSGTEGASVVVPGTYRVSIAGLDANGNGISGATGKSDWFYVSNGEFSL